MLYSNDGPDRGAKDIRLWLTPASNLKQIPLLHEIVAESGTRSNSARTASRAAACASRKFELCDWFDRRLRFDLPTGAPEFGRALSYDLGQIGVGQVWVSLACCLRQAIQTVLSRDASKPRISCRRADESKDAGSVPR